MSECRSCGAEIVWLKTSAGKNIPVDADTVADAGAAKEELAEAVLGAYEVE